MENNRKLMLTAPTVHCALPFCIAPCSVHSVGPAVVEHDLVLEPDDGGEHRKSFCTRRLR